jgi:hypothetical protein
MKIPRHHFFRPSGTNTTAPKRSEGGMITVVFIALLAIMVMLITVNGKTLFRLHREVKLLEQQQIKRLNGVPTNSVATTNLTVK